MNRQMLQISLIVLILQCQCACKKLATVPPPGTALVGTTVYSDDATAAAVLTGLYANMSSGNITGGSQSIAISCGLSADEFTLYGGDANATQDQFYTNTLSSQAAYLPWPDLYNYLLIVNSALEGLSVSNSLTASVKQQLQGEAEFMRAFCYFYLVNLYGDVPLTTTSAFVFNASVSRMPMTQVYNQIIADLKDAQNLLSPNFLGADAQTTVVDRVRPTKWAAEALLARVYLYVGDWADAVTEADSVISNNGEIALVNDLDSVFLANSNEAIWQLEPVIPEWNTQDAQVFILTNGPNAGQNLVYLSNYLLNAFEPNDSRDTAWVGVDSSTGTKYYYPYKYKSATYAAPVTEYLMMLRLGEQFLIRAEAEAWLGQGNAIADLNEIRRRANLPTYVGPTDQASLLKAIYHERQIELFSEWGQRWLDLKRTNTVDSIMGTAGECAAKGGTWSTDWQLYPIPFSDIKLDPNLKQNPGYN